MSWEYTKVNRVFAFFKAVVGWLLLNGILDL
jgi:hypothetical protein